MLEGNIQGLQHLGLPVTDIVRSKTFYTQIGFRPILETTLPSDSGTIQVAFLALNSFVLELYQPVGAEWDDIRGRCDGHIDHVALDVLDVQQAFEAVRAAGLQPLEDSPKYLPFWEKGIRYFNLRGPDGEKVEFSERIK